MPPQSPPVPPQLPLGAESPPPGEAEAIAKLRALHLQVHRVSPGSQFRGEHPKQHGGVWGTFQISRDIPAQYRQGLFQQPRDLRAFVRFSNGRSFDDRDSNVRGMAIKLFTASSDDVPPQNQDFLLADHPIFFAENVHRIYEFLADSSQGTPPGQLAAKFPRLIGYTKVATTSPLALSYWSQTPYQLGDGAVKYFATPSRTQCQTQPSFTLSDSPDRLREAMVEQLTRRKIGVDFDFCIHPQTDSVLMPVEDPTIEWTSEPVRLATLTIYPQTFDSPAQMEFVENCAWSPWNHLPGHRPLGGINRARQWVYADSQDLRHATRGISPPVPTGRESF